MKTVKADPAKGQASENTLYHSKLIKTTKWGGEEANNSLASNLKSLAGGKL